ncbi:phage portal protein [Amycolatopsis cihanbeyliensis]|uniref:SPP1 Gp6-like portal protein n=1 Tax=Amycolatopsis cihanbeyliensis TaxID=1128664 RepID=A0A542DNL9_AMYCI|nr:phage portal protein [Amycolatopsis cihanbeyliensis]TQJ04686.1 SPP1 Gp6-like portal protein [Amycolatopsis cihanbeyliensis]
MAASTYVDQVQALSDVLADQDRPLRVSESYYEATHRLEAVGLATPPEMRRVFTAAIGWPRTYIDAIEERLDVEGFALAGSSKNIDRLWDWWQVNNLDEASSLAHGDALIYGRSYVTVAGPDTAAGDDPDVPLIRVESPRHLYAEEDPRTGAVTRAARLYLGEDEGFPVAATLMLPDRTAYLVRDEGGRWRVNGRVIYHQLGQVPVVPIINRERLFDRHGHSEITPEIRSMTDAATRIMMNMQATAELMAVPQRLIFGAEQGELSENAFDAYLARILAFENETGKAFQFSAAELRNFTDALQEIAKHIASYTGLPPQYLSFNSDNPASAEAIRSAESRLVKKAERKQRMFGGAWERVMRLALKVMDREVPKRYFRLETKWRDAATPTFASKADAVSKLYNNGNGIIPLKRARQDMGYTAEEIKEMEQQDEADPINRLSALVGAPAAGVPSQAGSPPDDRDEGGRAA